MIRYIARAHAAVGRARGAVRRRYEAFLHETRRRSQWLGWLLATSLPHAGYVLGCVAAVRLAERLGVRARVQPLLWAATPLLATYAPAVRTLFSLNVPADTQHWLRFSQPRFLLPRSRCTEGRAKRVSKNIWTPRKGTERVLLLLQVSELYRP